MFFTVPAKQSVFKAGDVTEGADVADGGACEYADIAQASATDSEILSVYFTICSPENERADRLWLVGERRAQ